MQSPVGPPADPRRPPTVVLDVPGEGGEPARRPPDKPLLVRAEEDGNAVEQPLQLQGEAVLAGRRLQRPHAVVYSSPAPSPAGTTIADAQPPEARERQLPDVDQHRSGWRWPLVDRDTLAEDAHRLVHELVRVQERVAVLGRAEVSQLRPRLVVVGADSPRAKEVDDESVFGRRDGSDRKATDAASGCRRS